MLKCEQPNGRARLSVALLDPELFCPRPTRGPIDSLSQKISYPSRHNPVAPPPSWLSRPWRTKPPDHPLPMRLLPRSSPPSLPPFKAPGHRRLSSSAQSDIAVAPTHPRTRTAPPELLRPSSPPAEGSAARGCSSALLSPRLC